MKSEKNLEKNLVEAKKLANEGGGWLRWQARDFWNWSSIDRVKKNSSCSRKTPTMRKISSEIRAGAEKRRCLRRNYMPHVFTLVRI